MAAPRGVGKFIAGIRDILNRRAVKNHLRWETNYSPRTQPAPALPEGPSHALSANYYFTRDGRREVTRPEVAYGSPTAIQSGEEGGEQTAPKQSIAPRPGVPYNWD